MLAGLGAGMMEAIIAVTPSETIKTKMIEDSKLAEPRFKGLVHGVKTMVKEEGLRGVYRGVGPVVSVTRPAHPCESSAVSLRSVQMAWNRRGHLDVEVTM
jgi:hypothetical protein